VNPILPFPLWELGQEFLARDTRPFYSLFLDHNLLDV
jgi:hypothetical protein